LIFNQFYPYDILSAMVTLRKIENGPSMLSDAEVKAIEQGRADFAAGRYVDHETMSEWLKSWRTDPKRPSPIPAQDR
jgi:predicted transcriptional regulator